MTGAPSVSVIIPVLNGAATIGDTLAALQTQTGAPAGVQTLVVDNGSTDATAQIVRRFDVTLLEEAKRGPGAARNRGLRAAAGAVIAHLDADTIPARRWLTEIIAPFGDADVQLVGGRTLAFRPETAAERYVARAALFDAEATIARAVLPFVPSLNMAVRRDAALAIGGLGGRHGQRRGRRLLPPLATRLSVADGLSVEGSPFPPQPADRYGVAAPGARLW